MFRRLSGGKPVDDFAHRVGIEQFIGAHADNPHGAAAALRHEPFLLQHAKSFAHGGPAYLQRGGYLNLAKVITGRELPGIDALAKQIRNFVNQSGSAFPFERSFHAPYFNRFFAQKNGDLDGVNR